MPTELLCCMGIIVWILAGLFFWAVCAVGGMADDRMGYDEDLFGSRPNWPD